MVVTVLTTVPVGSPLCVSDVICFGTSEQHSKVQLRSAQSAWIAFFIGGVPAVGRPGVRSQVPKWFSQSLGTADHLPMDATRGH